MLAPCWRHVVPFKSQFVKSVNITSISLGFMIDISNIESSHGDCKPTFTSRLAVPPRIVEPLDYFHYPSDCMYQLCIHYPFSVD